MLIKDLAEYLASQGVGTFNSGASGGNIFLAIQPNEPDACVALYEYGGGASVIGLPDSIRGVQVLVRGTTYPSAHAKAWAIYDVLITNLTNDGRFLSYNGRKLLISANTGPINIGKDEKGRHEISINFQIWAAGA